MTVPGTAEETWAAWPFLRTLPSLDLPTGRLVIVSAHPDDEVLGAGGLIAMLAMAARAPVFVTVTDGEASHAASRLIAPTMLAERRSLELTESLATLGVKAADVTRLRLPDSSVADHVDRLAEELEQRLLGADLVLCPSQDDGHPDHVAVAHVTLGLCAGRVPVWQFPIWVWHWTSPGDDGVDWARAVRLPLTLEAERRKSEAVACFTSQTVSIPEDVLGTAILPPEVLEHFTRPYEVFFT